MPRGRGKKRAVEQLSQSGLTEYTSALDKSNKETPIGMDTNPMSHLGLIHKILHSLHLRQGTPLYEEAEGEATCAMVRAIKKYNPNIAQYNTYAGKAAYNAAAVVVRDFLKKKNIRLQHDVNYNMMPAPNESNVREAVMSLLYNCIRQLDDEEAQIIMMKMYNKSLKNISRELRMSYNKVKLKYHSALCSLKTMLLFNDSTGCIDDYFS